ncbi:hypothetical protein EFZ10_13765 [Tatumella sp. TA1]|nr:hypothetical protein EFZ10_13765 [Tatumella sp. TA1]
MLKNKHLTGNIFTQYIERNNLTLSIRNGQLARYTFSFSHSVTLNEISL